MKEEAGKAQVLHADGAGTEHRGAATAQRVALKGPLRRGAALRYNKRLIMVSG